MILSIRRIIELMKMFLLFIMLSFIFYQLISFISDLIEPMDPYREPIGRAVKVFHYQGGDGEKARHRSLKEQLFFYFRYGE